MFFFRYCSHTHHLLSTLSIPTLVSGRQLPSRADKSGHCTDRRQRNVVSQQLARIKGAGRFFPQTFAMAQVALPLYVCIVPIVILMPHHFNLHFSVSQQLLSSVLRSSADLFLEQE